LPSDPLIRLILALGPERRLALAAVIGAAVSWLTWAALPFPFQLALGWIVGVAFFLGTTALVIDRITPRLMRQRARRQDAYSAVILSVVVAAAAVSLIALGFMLQQKGGTIGAGMRILLAGLAVICSWTLTHTIYALHYAHLYYGDDPDRRGKQDRGGLKFPHEGVPDFWDFLYFSFVIGMTCQVSDVQVTGRHIRRLALAHGVLAFFFNAGILALAVNYIAGAI
jgi:uncharacterized membrane protein